MHLGKIIHLITGHEKWTGKIFGGPSWHITATQ